MPTNNKIVANAYFRFAESGTGEKVYSADF